MTNKKAVSVKDIASELHVSLSTVHKALTGKPGVGAARRREVLECAERLGYVVNTTAQALSRKAFRLGIITPARWPEYFDILRNGIEKRIDELREFRVMGLFYTIPANADATEPAHILEWVRDTGVDAVLYCPSHFAINEIAEQALSQLSCPVFFVGGGAENALHVPAITIDAVLAGKLAADFLTATTAMPCAAIFTGSLKSAVHKAKSDAFVARMRENGGSVVEILETEDEPRNAERAVAALFAAHPTLNCIYVSTLTSGPICRYIEEKGLSHVRVIGTDLFEELRDYLRRGVMQATLSQNQQQVGAAAVSYAFEYFCKKNSYGGAELAQKEQLLISPTLLLRAHIE